MALFLSVRKNRGMKPINHGTDAGYARHRYYGTEPCDACRKAHNKYDREYRRRTGKVKYQLVLLPPIQPSEGVCD